MGRVRERCVIWASAADVSHATKALGLVQSLGSYDKDVARHLQDARNSLVQYRQLTSTVLARLQLPIVAGS